MGRRSGIDGRELILDAALRLFSEQGIDAVSIRAVNREAGLGPASVHYHFGTKDALVDAVIALHGSSVVDKTKAHAQAILASESAPTAKDLVTMMAEPYLDLIATPTSDGQAWVSVISSLLHSNPTRVLDRPSSRLTWAAARMAYPEAAPEAIQRGMRMCFSLLVTQLAHASRSARKSTDLDVDLLIDFLTAGLDRALSPPPANTAPRRSRAS